MSPFNFWKHTSPSTDHTISGGTPSTQAPPDVADGHGTDAYERTLIPISPANVNSVSAGHYHSLAIVPSFSLLLALLCCSRAVGCQWFASRSSSSNNWVYVNSLRPAEEIRFLALVIGPTDGIGKAFAFEFARCSKTLIKNVVVDFSGDLDEGVERIKESIEGLDVGVSIKNGGYMDRLCLSSWLVDGVFVVLSSIGFVNLG